MLAVPQSSVARHAPREQQSVGGDAGRVLVTRGHLHDAKRLATVPLAIVLAVGMVGMMGDGDDRGQCGIGDRGCSSFDEMFDVAQLAVRALSKREQRAAVRAAHGMGQARGDLLEHCRGSRIEVLSGTMEIWVFEWIVDAVRCSGD